MTTVTAVTTRTRTTRTATRFALGALSVGVLAVGLPLVSASAAGAAPAAQALVRSAHFSPDTASVDVYLTSFGGTSSTLWVSAESYGGVSAYRSLAAGQYVVSMRPHGAPSTSAPALTWTLDARAGRAYTAAAVGQAAALKAQVLTDDLTPPPAGDGRIRVVQAASAAPVATISTNGGKVIAARLPFASTTDYTVVPAGTWDLRAVTDGPPPLTTTDAVPVPANSATTIVLLDTTAGAVTFVSVLDAAGSPTVPVGSVDAGGGGTATAFDADTSTSTRTGTGRLTAAAGLLIGAVALGRSARRRRRG